MSNNLRCEDLIDMLDDMIDQAIKLPFTKGRCSVEVDKIRDIIDDIRQQLPQEIQKAKKIISDRQVILSMAKEEAENIRSEAENRARTLIDENEIVRAAEQRASEILMNAQTKAKEMKRAACQYSDEMLKRTEQAISENASEIRKARQAIKGSAVNKTDDEGSYKPSEE